MAEPEYSDADQTKIDNVNSILRGGTGLSFTPRYLKPVAFLEQLTPFLKVDLVISSVDDPSQPFTKTTRGTSLFSIPHNNIKSFEYLIHQGSSETIKLDLVDPDFTVLEMLALKFRTIGQSSVPVKLQIEYGWTPPKRPQYGVHYTNKVTSILVDFKMNYTSDAIEATFVGTAENELPAPYDMLTPFMEIGRVPFVEVAMNEWIYGPNAVYRRSEDESAIKNWFTLQSAQLYRLNKYKNKKMIFQHMNSLSWLLNVNEEVNESDIDFYKIDKKKGTKKFAKTALSKILKTMSALDGSPAIKDDKTKKIIDSGEFKLDEKSPVQSYLASALAIRKDLSIPSGAKNSVRTNLEKITELHNFLLPTIHEMKKHPWDCINFLKESLATQVKRLETTGKSIGVVFLDMFDENTVLGRKPDGTIDKTSLKNYGVSVKKLNTTGKSWKGLFEEIGAYVKIGIPNSTPEPVGLTEKQKKASKTKYPNIANLNVNYYVADKHSSAKTIELMEVIVKDKTLKNAKTQLNYAKSQLGKDHLIFVIFSVLPSTGVFSGNLAENKVLQAYTHRPSRNKHTGEFVGANVPGKDIKFPDVKSYNPTIDFWKAVQGINSTTSVTNQRNGSIETTEESKLGKDAEKAIADAPDSEKELLQKKSAIQFPLKVPILGTPSAFNTGDNAYESTFSAKQSVGNLRRRVALEGKSFEVAMEVLGDASFNVNDTTGLIYTDVVMPDGSYSMLGGFFQPLNITQKVTQDSFDTVFKLKSVVNPELNSDLMDSWNGDFSMNSQCDK